jgi:phosphatidylglycerol:prolipoprotein diacylglycerol transferase
MIPYFHVPSLRLGPLELHAFGALVALGVFVAGRVALRRAEVTGPANGVDPEVLRDALPWALGAGLVGAHLLHLFAYHPEEYKGGLSVLRVWDGLSSLGGVLGGLLGLMGFLWRRRQRQLTYLDTLAYGVAPGWTLGRVGCFLAHDHRGRLTEFPLAVKFPTGARHDLGLYETFLLGGISLLIYLVGRKTTRPGIGLGILALLYGVGRYLLDFLRATDLSYVDARYYGWTPAQYLSVAFVATGAALLVRAVSTTPAPPSVTAAVPAGAESRGKAARR